MASVRVVVGKDGKVRMEGVGFQGPACEGVTRKLQEAMGGQAMDEEYKPEYWLPATEQGTVDLTGSSQ